MAGVGTMSYRRFAAYNVIGGVAWVAMFTAAGYRFAELPMVKKNFHYVILAIVVLSCVPPVVEFLKARREPAS